ncbi:cytochrome d ubiquinol oxidase, subunit II [Methylocella silvestris BL2]|uniref:Cytochrome d ubiquinol oxidase, subunit II n=1 Tax=Methylocella silvestris (strain DSM 15510 / CIP 108128 / LMG 27833 / NCIMB 13906 / BL2) TaxID=395965 RepID=B8ESY7_METSB|nr:cytochrome d ubiquinol oxidase subunit II [Methylocella silvestris]ACK51125.1 cytochrome d ubiquinol oxidase, subunit II [Methylocella silvestris BL2]
MTEFWTAVLAFTILLYVLLDGFDLGVGMLLALMPNDRGRRHMLAAIAPVWDGNETWLVVTATILFGVFPLVYSILLSAFYLPVFVMLAGLILRGVSFEFREKSPHHRAFWDSCFILGSLVASFIQGMMIGALVEGLPVENGRYAGGPFGWLSSFALLCGAGLCVGYALLGAGWLTRKTTQDVQALAFGILPSLLAGVLAFLAIIFVYSLLLDLAVMHRWRERPVLFVFPLMGIAACVIMAVSIRRRRELLPFLSGASIFAAAFLTLAVSFYPYMIPFSVTIAEAAAPRSSQAFMFWGAGLIVLPITIIYTLVVYFVFKGKVIDLESYDEGPPVSD